MLFHIRKGITCALIAGVTAVLTAALPFTAITTQASAVHTSDALTANIAVQPGVTSDFAILVDLANQRVIAGKNAEEYMHPASMTKIMTVLVASEHIKNLNEQVTITQDSIDYAKAIGLSRVGFVAGETVPVSDLLFGTILPSGADAAIMLARYIGGTEEGFVALMNQKAAALGLKKTHFVNCHGMTAANHYSTCADMSTILQAATENQMAWTVLSTQTYKTTLTPQHPQGIQIANLFLRRIGTQTMPGLVFSAKTGCTDAAGYCAASYFVTWTQHPYICVTAHTTSAMKAVYDHAAIYGLYANQAYEKVVNNQLAAIGYPGAASTVTALQ